MASARVGFADSRTSWQRGCLVLVAIVLLASTVAAQVSQPPRIPTPFPAPGPLTTFPTLPRFPLVAIPGVPIPAMPCTPADRFRGCLTPYWAPGGLGATGSGPRARDVGIATGLALMGIGAANLDGKKRTALTLIVGGAVIVLASVQTANESASGSAR